ncbi:unnamed protein product [Microthlaspi erraticum]|uniref:PUM-HD domain-containing protein n=1 Tax=Microthlaspi erraticum TaxID=1685480 RepID=A0A6D2HHI1_9BRAS|nr:unnamed protein product [Microthlaspi erraticum]
MKQEINQLGLLQLGVILELETLRYDHSTVEAPTPLLIYLVAKLLEEAEARKKRRRPRYTFEQELTSLWEKMRRRDIAKEDRSKLISEAVQKMKGKIPEIARSSVSSRVLQTCVKYCSQAEKEAVFNELQPRFLDLASKKYAVHVLTKMLDGASKPQRAVCISSLRGRVARLLRHMSGSIGMWSSDV